MSLILPTVSFIFGLTLIIKGGDLFVEAAVWIARVSGIPKVIIGATIVSLATTLPEITVSLLAAMAGKADLAIGNAVGSVTANLGLILGTSLLFSPLPIRRRDYACKGLLMVIAVTVLLAFSGTGRLKAGGSFLLLVIFALSVMDSIRSAGQNRENRTLATPLEKSEAALHLLWFALGIGGILWGARLLVDNGSLLAIRLGVPESVIGVTLVAVGTSLPELVTAVAALMKKEGALSVGNILGANLIDTTLILPLCGFISGTPLHVSLQSLLLDLPVCLLAAVITVVPTLLQGKFSRLQGISLLGLYLVYLMLVIA